MKKSLTPDKKSGNPNNPECSSCKQAILDLISAGFQQDMLNEVLKLIDNDKDRLKTADKTFNNHKHPPGSITFTRLQNDVEFSRNISAYATAILTVMCQHMRHGNLIQLSQDDIVKITGIGNKKTASKAIQELIENGHIAVKIKGNTRFSTVYMVNPKIAVVGNEIQGLQHIFWITTGSEYDLNRNEYIYSIPHQKWIVNTNERTYSIGYDRQETNHGTDYFSKINPPKLDEEKKISGAVTPEINDSSNDELPI